MRAALIWDIDGTMADTDRDRREREVTGYYLSDAFRNDVILHTGPMHQPMDVMRTCLDDLLTRWGLDPKADRLKTREVELNAGDSLWGKLGNIIGVRRDSGMARARLLIDEAGQLTDCHVLEGLPAGERADAFCEAVRKEAEFEPALDRSAQPMRSYYILDFAAIRRRSF